MTHRQCTISREGGANILDQTTIGGKKEARIFLTNHKTEKHKTNVILDIFSITARLKLLWGIGNIPSSDVTVFENLFYLTFKLNR